VLRGVTRRGPGAEPPLHLPRPPPCPALACLTARCPARVQTLADNLYKFLTTYMLDPTDNTFFDNVNQDGTKPASPSKSLNANNYALYALASYGRQCSSPAASQAALAAWKAWDASSWVGGTVGYDDTVKGGGLAGWLAAWQL
jgi:hypothetical protein